ncbi:hypothetical protein CK203_003885 [Vitis vinifera]|uniref:Reverse transcriptase domain-containing protein n=1 Tax=Vitis vinifera TaxID=29760 RepID=A0A438K8L8_VITVI|nr:hypothetical protein CK203_003885 [Vitis vinifera]
MGSDQIVPQVTKAGGELNWEKSDLAKFSKFLGFSTEGLEKDIMNFLVKIRKRRERVHNKTLLEKSKFERELKRLECSINYEGGKKQNGGEQETKIQTLSEGLVRSLGSGRWSNWVALDALGSAGGMLVCWDKRSLEVMETEVGKFSVSYRIRNVEDGLTWIFTGVYGPFSKKDRDCLWEELGAIRGLWEDPWCLGGDFNVILSQKERSRQGRLTGAMRSFAQTVDELELLDLPMQGGVFTWSGGRNNQSWARLDRMRKGPTSFRFENMWLKVDDFKGLLQGWWQGIEVRGRTSFRLASKLKVLKQKIKVWNREVFRRLEVNKNSALQQLEYWDGVESERSLSIVETEQKKEAKDVFFKWVLMEEVHWRQKSRELWLKEGDRNTCFFHRMANAHRRNNSLDRIMINGEWLTEDQEVRKGIVNAFQNLLSEESGWRADIEGLHLNQLNSREAEDLEMPFSEEEIHFALTEMRGDKFPGPDGFTAVFWQACWDFVKEEVVDLFKEFYEHGSFAKCLNTTFLVLIPKKGGAKDLGISNPSACLRILDASLIANEVIDYWHKRKEKGLICKLDIEKAYDSINWKFLMKVLRKMGFGSRWMDWMWWCISTAKFSILINGVLAGFFSNSKGLRQGDPLSPYLFVLGMEMLSTLLRRAVRKEQLTNLSWILAWFEAASGLRINLAKSVLIPVGEVDELEELAAELGCRLGALPTVYLGLPLGAHHKTSSSWDGVEERMRRRLAQWKRQYISKGEELLLSRALWSAYPSTSYPLSAFLRVKYGQEGCGWRTKEVCGSFGVGLWKEIMKEVDWCWESIEFKLFTLAGHRNAKVSEVWDSSLGQGGWNLSLARDFNDWELDQVGDMLNLLRDFRTSPEEDSVRWKREGNGVFRVKGAYKMLIGSSACAFPNRRIWMDKVPTKVSFFAWEASWGKILTLDKLQRRGW